jgi:hypothetical protein
MIHRYVSIIHFHNILKLNIYLFNLLQYIKISDFIVGINFENDKVEKTIQRRYFDMNYLRIQNCCLFKSLRYFNVFINLHLKTIN